MATVTDNYFKGNTYTRTVNAGDDLQVELFGDDNRPGAICTVVVTGTTITGNVYYATSPTPVSDNRGVLAEGGALTAVDSAGFSFDTQITGIKVEATTNTHTVDIIG